MPSLLLSSTVLQICLGAPLDKQAAEPVIFEEKFVLISHSGVGGKCRELTFANDNLNGFCRQLFSKYVWVHCSINTQKYMKKSWCSFHTLGGGGKCRGLTFANDNLKGFCLQHLSKYVWVHRSINERHTQKYLKKS